MNCCTVKKFYINVDPTERLNKILHEKKEETMQNAYNSRNMLFATHFVECTAMLPHVCVWMQQKYDVQRLGRGDKPLMCNSVFFIGFWFGFIAAMKVTVENYYDYIWRA